MTKGGLERHRRRRLPINTSSRPRRPLRRRTTSSRHGPRCRPTRTPWRTTRPSPAEWTSTVSGLSSPSRTTFTAAETSGPGTTTSPSRSLNVLHAGEPGQQRKSNYFCLRTNHTKAHCVLITTFFSVARACRGTAMGPPGISAKISVASEDRSRSLPHPTR